MAERTFWIEDTPELDSKPKHPVHKLPREYLSRVSNSGCGRAQQEQRLNVYKYYQTGNGKVR
jgi:hypothetical protein